SNRSACHSSSSSLPNQSIKSEALKGPATASGYAQGDICCIRESTATPIEHILAAHPAIHENPRLLKKCEDALRRIKAEGSMLGKERPCILLCTIPSGVRTAPTVCLMGTFGGTPFEELSEIFKMFCIPLYPNLGQDGSVPVHSTPEWPSSEDQWIIAYSFESSRFIKGHWRLGSDRRLGISAGSTDVLVCRLDADAQAFLREQSAMKMKEWEERTSRDPNLAVRCALEFRAVR
ncbi:hypothetical protein OH77DRAFT_1363432, partial [Trametes cingulata]